MPNRHWMNVLAITFLFVAVTNVCAFGRRPNVIILMPDQMRAQAMGLAGNDQVITPQLDRLASGGVYLPNTFANSPVCSPARATILTGLYPHRHGLIVNDLRLRESQVTMAEVLGGAGYATGFVGKWHLDGGKRMPGYIPPGPRRQGFQFWAANSCNHQHFKSCYFHDSDQPIEINEFETKAWMDEAIGFVRENRDRPFFLCWWCGPPHNPYKAPPEFRKLYDPDRLKLRPNWQSVDRLGTHEDIAEYYAMVTAIDVEVGRLMDVLDEQKIADDTIVLFISDHGDMLGSHGLAFKCKPWEESIRVPGIIRYPRCLPKGVTSDVMLSHVDIMPTLLAMCGVARPSDLQGRDLVKPLASGSVSGSEAVYLKIYEPREPWGVPAAWRGIRTRRYTYARLRDRPWVLYDLEKDPYQLENLADDPAHSELRSKLDLLLAEEMSRSGDNWAVNLREHVQFHRGPAVYRPCEIGKNGP